MCLELAHELSSRMEWEQQQQRQDQEEEKHLTLSKPFSLRQEDWREFTKQIHTKTR